MYIYSPTAHTTGPIMTKPGMMMVPHLGMVHTIFQGKGKKVKVIAYVYILIYSPHHWTDHDQTWHDDGPHLGMVPERTAKSRSERGYLY